MTLDHCLYGPADGFPVISHGGTPSTRWKRPDMVQAMHDSGVRVLVADRPGYGGSPRRPGRTVADVVPDVMALADAQGWERFAVFGGSGGGPHALACAALMPDRVIRCAVLSGIKPPEGTGPPDEPTLRTRLEEITRFARPWGFTMAEIAVPVGLWYGTDDENVPADQARWLLAHIPGAQGHQYAGGHLPAAATYREIYAWLRAERPGG